MGEERHTQSFLPEKQRYGKLEPRPTDPKLEILTAWSPRLVIGFMVIVHGNSVTSFGSFQGTRKKELFRNDAMVSVL